MKGDTDGGVQLPTREERDTLERFTVRYRIGQSDVTRQMERAVIGGDWGANGYTTMAQADRMADVLGLRPGNLLLDIGSGRGWPGLYIAKKTGCSVVVSDIPLDALRDAKARADAELLTERVAITACGARGLPFRPRAFDAIVHTDVLC
jgi:SAM-dependent methyltransferase